VAYDDLRATQQRQHLNEFVAEGFDLVVRLGDRPSRLGRVDDRRDERPRAEGVEARSDANTLRSERARILAPQQRVPRVAL
jgi:hypothetical protein